jgi:4-amino-4-deoxy-L-arabinose transferase-like glycosyltransferase
MWEDQALTLNAALEWVHGGALPLASMKSSFGVFNPPLVQYLYALPLFISTRLLGVVGVVALVNLAGVFAAGWAAARVWGWRVAWWATLLFAVNPWAVYYGRLIWMQSFVPGFAGLTLAFALLYFGRAQRWTYALGAALCLSATIQVHLTAVVLVPVLLVVALVFRRQVRWPHLLGAGGVFAITWLPFLWFEIRNNFVDWHALRAGLGLRPNSAPPRPSSCSICFTGAAAWPPSSCPPISGRPTRGRCPWPG